MKPELVFDSVVDDATRRVIAAALARESLADDVQPAILGGRWLRASLQEGVERSVADPNSEPAAFVPTDSGVTDYAPLPRRTRGATRA